MGDIRDEIQVIRQEIRQVEFLMAQSRWSRTEEEAIDAYLVGLYGEEDFLCDVLRGKESR